MEGGSGLNLRKKEMNIMASRGLIDEQWAMTLGKRKGARVTFFVVETLSSWKKVL